MTARSKGRDVLRSHQAVGTRRGRHPGAATAAARGLDRRGGHRPALQPHHARRGLGPPRQPSSLRRWTQQWAAECLRVVKPGGYVIAFGAPRTFHRLVAASRTQGWRSVICWCGCIRRACRSPGGSPVGSAAPSNPPTSRSSWHASHRSGRWPRTTPPTAPDCWTSMPARYEWPVRPIAGPATLSSAREGMQRHVRAGLSGRSARCPVPGAARVAFCTAPRRRPPSGRRAATSSPCGTSRSTTGSNRPGRHGRNFHPTVKPVALMRWLIRMTCPPGGTVLDPFTGSGSTGSPPCARAARFLGIERDGAYVDLACARITHWARQQDGTG